VDVVRDLRSALEDATLQGLRAHEKELPAVWLYGDKGSQLYEKITRLPEYYLPRREAEILRARGSTIAERTRARTLIELGAGSARNTRYLLGADTLERFVPLDVSEQALRASAAEIAAAYPRLDVHAVVGDFEQDLAALPGGGRRLIALLGSTIGNLDPERRARFLEAVAGAFVRNALDAVNAELGATFDQSRFAYDARWDADHEWMDIGLRSRSSYSVAIAGLAYEMQFEKDEFLRVEISAKFRRGPFAGELGRAGLRLDAWWNDRAGDFALALCSRRREEI
jgi:L-histidine N-alpha-methyltransferase